ETGQSELPHWKEEHNASHRKVRARVEHVFARMKGWKILRDCRLKDDGVHHAMLGIARLHNSSLPGDAETSRPPDTSKIIYGTALRQRKMTEYSTGEHVDSSINVHIVPRLGSRKLNSVT